MKTVAVFCGGESYEHEVSVITGIQVASTMDRSRYIPILVYLDKDNNPFVVKKFSRREDFYKSTRKPIAFEKTKDGFVLKETGVLGASHTVDIAYLAFHGGTGESGGMQGLLEVMNVPFTSPSSEGSVICMNKTLTKQVLRDSQVPVLDGVSVFSDQYRTDSAHVLKNIQTSFSFPVIIKPVHLGSSIAIEIAHNDVELEKFLNVATRVDTEVLVEPALQHFTEYNVSARTNNGQIELSPIEEPKRESEFLSFEDKYTKGGKKGVKSGAKSGGGMEMLDRTVPADIPNKLAEEIKELAQKIFVELRLAGLVRIDFMYHDGTLYCTEVNPIPGSMSFYLWEPTGQQFMDQITHSLQDAEARQQKKIKIVPYETDIVEKFINQNKPGLYVQATAGALLTKHAHVQKRFLKLSVQTPLVYKGFLSAAV